MSYEAFIITQFVAFFGLLASFCIWQLRSVGRDIRATAARRSAPAEDV